MSHESTPGGVATLARPMNGQRVRTATIVVADDRPMIRAGILAALALDDNLVVAADCPLRLAVEAVETHRPDVMVVVLREGDPEPFRAMAAAKALRDELHVLSLADNVTSSGLREAVIAGTDGFLLTHAPLAEVASAIAATARGERVVSPEVAVHLVGSWRSSDGPDRASLTPREMDVLELLAEGMTNSDVGARLEVSPRTVKTHVQNLLAKLDVPDRTGAVARGFRLGLIR